MKVVDVMSRDIDFVGKDASIQEVSRHIFGRGVNGVPVCEERKVIGFITERDILAQFYPTIEEYIEDPIHTSDFEEMEKQVDQVMHLTAEDIMTKNPTSVTQDTPLLRAQSLMFVHKVGRLPVVDEKGNLIGIISKGDIFRGIIGKRLPYWEEEEFYDWLSQYLDDIIDWKKRLHAEMPDLVALFKKEKIKTVLDVGASSGEHTIALAKEGFDSYGVEIAKGMHLRAQDHKEKLKPEVKKNVTFVLGAYHDAMKRLPKKIDAAIFMGNAFPHSSTTDPDILDDVIKTLDKKAIVVFQLVNIHKRFAEFNGLRSFVQTNQDEEKGKKHAFIGFYSKRSEKELLSVGVVLNFDGNRWAFQNMSSTPMKAFGQKEMVTLLKKKGFSAINVYGSSFYEPLLSNPFDETKSDWLTIVAKR